MTRDPTKGEGSVRYYDARGNSLGTSTTNSTGTATFYDPRGNVTGRAGGPAPMPGFRGK
jgi:YD repeat-containing protein